jgi:hypothetical protein
MASFVVPTEAGSITQHVYAPGCDSGNYATIGPCQKTSDYGYTTVYVDTSYGTYLTAYCQVQVFNGSNYVNASDKRRCTKGTTYTFGNTSGVSFVSGTYLRLKVWSGSSDNMDYDKVTWNYN